MTAQLCSTRLASGWKRWCNSGETLNARAQRNAKEMKPTTNARPWFIERPDVLMVCELLSQAYFAQEISATIYEALR